MSPLIKIFKIIALLEGLSYILLLCIAVPIKYYGNDPQYVKMLGMPHGLLFMAYLALTFFVAHKLNWNKKTSAIVLVASVIPFGAFYVDRVYLKKRINDR